MNKILLLLLFSLLIISCDNKEKSNELVKKANEFFINSNLDDKIRLDSSLVLINKAIQLNENNFRAYEAKFSISSEKKDIDGMFESSSKLIELKPNQPYWKLKKGFVLELKNQPKKADSILSKMTTKYKSENQKQILQFYKNDTLTKEKVINMWKSS